MEQNNVKLGIVCFANDGGLGAQTRRLAYMLKPYKVLVIDSTSFSRNKQHNIHWYQNFKGYMVDGFPTNHEIKVFLKDLTHVLVCENPLNFFLFSEAYKLGIKTYCQSNYEFCDNLRDLHLPRPDMFLMPSYWKIEEMKKIFGRNDVMHLPPPIDMNEFKEARDTNINRTGQRRFVHILGTLAAHDRNGTLDLLNALKYTTADFELVIKSQHDLPQEYLTDDKRVKYVIGNEVENANLYKDFDAMILPRRYGGLSLGCNEALASALPVIMPDISPNNELLHEDYLVKAEKTSTFMARVPIDVFTCNLMDLAGKIDWLVGLSDKEMLSRKMDSFDKAHRELSVSALQHEYEKLWLQ